MKKKGQFISAGILIRGNMLNPEHVSHVLGVQPSRSQTSGKAKSQSSRFLARTGLWALSVRSKSRSVSALVDELLQQLGSPSVRLDAIEGCDEAFLDIFVPMSHCGKVDGALEITLTRAQMSRLMNLGLSVSLTIT